MPRAYVFAVALVFAAQAHWLPHLGSPAPSRESVSFWDSSASLWLLLAALATVGPFVAILARRVLAYPHKT